MARELEIDRRAQQGNELTEKRIEEQMPRRRATQRPQVERKIYFYRVDAGLDAAGRPVPFNPVPVLRHLHGLPFTDDGLYWDAGDGHDTCCWVDVVSSRGRLRFGNVRRSGLPQVERAGEIGALGIPASAGLLEQVHVLFFPHNIVGSEFNFYGPRISRLSRYMAAKANGTCPPVTFEPLLRQDVMGQIDRLVDIRLLQLKIHASYADVVAEADQDLGSAFEAAARAGQAEELEIILRPRAHSRQALTNRLLETVKRLARGQELRQESSRFSIKGLDAETERVETVDILKDQLISKKRIILENERTRALDSESAYAAIDEAYNELRDKLLVAAGVQL